VNSADTGPTGTGQSTTHLGRLRELAALLLKLSAISFGGPAAHIALMETEIVRKREWITGQQFFDMVRVRSFLRRHSSDIFWAAFRELWSLRWGYSCRDSSM